MSHCRIHGWYSDSEDGCFECRFAEEQNQQRMDDIADRLGRSAWDSGDYICPRCRYKSLRRNADRCPVCHTNPGSEFWRQVDSEERAKGNAAVAAAEQARLRKIQEAEEWERGAPAREAAAKEAVAAESRKDASHRATFIIRCYLGFLGPVLFWCILTYLSQESDRGKSNGFCLLFVPVLNWFYCLGVLFSHTDLALRGFLICGLVVFAMWALLRTISSAVLVGFVGLAFGVATVLWAMSHAVEP